MGCLYSCFGIPNDTKVHINTDDDLKLLITSKDTVRVVPLRRSLDVVVVKRNNIKEPVLIQQEHLRIEPDRPEPRRHQR